MSSPLLVVAVALLVVIPEGDLLLHLPFLLVIPEGNLRFGAARCYYPTMHLRAAAEIRAFLVHHPHPAAPHQFLHLIDKQPVRRHKHILRLEHRAELPRLFKV